MRGGVILWSLMASAPVLLLGVMGIVGRTQINTWEFESYSPKENLALLAYQQPMAIASSIRSIDPHEPRYKKLVDQAVSSWFSGQDREELVDVLPGSMEDQGSSGVKSQIIEARQILINGLHVKAMDAYRKGSAYDYCFAHAQIVAVADVSKYSGVTTIQQSALVQIGSLRRIASQWQSLNPDQQKAVKDVLTRSRRSPAPLAPLAERLSHLAIRRKMTFNVSMKDLDSVFHASQLASLSAADGVSIYNMGRDAEKVGLDSTLGLTLSAALKAEKKFVSLVNLLFDSPEPSALEAAAQPGF
jgi:hypothetical protein